jgi:hypothetical protein
MLDKSISNHFKVSNEPILIGWNPTMSIQLILAQLKTLHSEPGDQVIWSNDKLLKSDFMPKDAPEMLFH